MILDEVLALLDEMLAPLPAEQFFEMHLGRSIAVVPGSAAHPRARLLGEDARRTVLEAWATHHQAFGFHAADVTGPPPPRDGVDSPERFAALVAEYQARGYTLHIPDMAPLSPALARLARALEAVLHQPVKTSLFWSRPGNRAPVHYDDRDNLAIQLIGRKRWFVSEAPPSLHNAWRGVAEGPQPLGPHRVIEAGPGDLLFLPRGLLHTVQTVEESLHLSITLLPTTVREAMLAALDHLSDYDRDLRETALGRVDRLAADLPAIQAQVVAGLERLLAQCRSPGFVASALQRRASRFVGDLPKLAATVPPLPLTSGMALVHAEGAISMMLATPDLIDFALPGEHLHVHRAAEAALRFIAARTAFRLEDVPGLQPELRDALIVRLMQSGFLRAAPTHA